MGGPRAHTVVRGAEGRAQVGCNPVQNIYVGLIEGLMDSIFTL
jgi:hypothetical protein